MIKVGGLKIFICLIGRLGKPALEMVMEIPMWSEKDGSSWMCECAKGILIVMNLSIYEPCSDL